VNIWDAWKEEWFLFKADLFGVAADLLQKVIVIGLANLTQA